ncbi:2697_t:CDS:2 [Scutellospora calospora]|uniref:2697_t:CDS:1 n=1 Tax=Scutellospora calospora TaxID=85575 RepID=A0ACA9K9Q2_9GLOM|nr:2697_t:CDS:2 [Scutellospora calospora]
MIIAKESSFYASLHPGFTSQEYLLSSKTSNEILETTLKELAEPNERIDDYSVEQNEEIKAQYKKLETTIYCEERCFQNLIFHEHAITNYQKFQNLNNNQKDMFLLGIISATIRQETTTKNQKRNKLANKYIFEGIEICNKAFLIIYGIGEKYWKNIRTHFIQQGISLRIHKSTGKTSHFAILFETGNIYFKSLYNIQLFGICEDAFPIQKNYLIKEEESIGKGANAVISLVHNYFTFHGLGETNLVIHADNSPILVTVLTN